MSKPNFKMMWDHFPTHKKYPTLRSLHTFIGGALVKNIEAQGFGPNGNTCAVRMSRALNYAHFPISAKQAKAHKISTMTGADGKLYIYRVRELKVYLEAVLGVTPIKVFKDFDKAFMGRQGVVVFEVSGWRSAGGHIALWNGKEFREDSHDDYRNQRDDPATAINEGTTTGMTLWPL